MTHKFFVLREMRRGDLKQVVELDAICYPLNPWKASSFRHWLKSNPLADELLDEVDAHVVVDQAENRVIGYAITQIPHDAIDHQEVIKLGVHPDYRKQGAGTQLILNILNIRPKRIKVMFTIINEKNLTGQVWARELGWKCVQTLPKFYDTEDAYCFEIGG
jgi:ribosomal protein S18 acetylase RimI-like enzyme